MAQVKSKTATSQQAKWSAHCAFLLKDRAEWLDDYEHRMLNDNLAGDREPTDAQIEFAKRIAYETEEITNFDGYSVPDLIQLAKSCVAELSFEEEEDVLELAKTGRAKVSRRKARRLLAIARRWAI